MTTLQNPLSTREYVLAGLQSAFGMEAGPMVLLPVNPGTGQYQGGKQQLRDAGRSGVLARDFSAQEGVGEGTVTIESNLRIPTANTHQMNGLGYLVASLLDVDDYDAVAVTGDNDARQHVLVQGDTARFLTVKQGVAGVYEDTFRDCRVTSMDFTFNTRGGEAAFMGYSATLMGQDPFPEPEARPGNRVYAVTGEPMPAWNMLMDIPEGAQSEADVKSIEYPAGFSLPADTNGDVEMLTIRIERENPYRFWALDGDQEMNNIFCGAVVVSGTMTVILQQPSIRQIYRRKVQGPLTLQGFYDIGHGLEISIRTADFANDLLTIDTSDTVVKVPFGILGLYDRGNAEFNYAAAPDATSQNGSIAFNLRQEQDDDDLSFTDAVPLGGTVGGQTTKAALSDIEGGTGITGLGSSVFDASTAEYTVTGPAIPATGDAAQATGILEVTPGSNREVWVRSSGGEVTSPSTMPITGTTGVDVTIPLRNKTARQASGDVVTTMARIYVRGRGADSGRVPVEYVVRINRTVS